MVTSKPSDTLEREFEIPVTRISPHKKKYIYKYIYYIYMPFYQLAHFIPINSRLCELRIDYLIEDGEVRNGDQKVRKYYFPEILYGRQAVFHEDFFSRIIWVGGVKRYP